MPKKIKIDENESKGCKEWTDFFDCVKEGNTSRIEEILNEGNNLIRHKLRKQGNTYFDEINYNGKTFTRQFSFEPTLLKDNKLYENIVEEIKKSPYSKYERQIIKDNNVDAIVLPISNPDNQGAIREICTRFPYAYNLFDFIVNGNEENMVLHEVGAPEYKKLWFFTHHLSEEDRLSLLLAHEDINKHFLKYIGEEMAGILLKRRNGKYSIMRSELSVLHEVYEKVGEEEFQKILKRFGEQKGDIRVCANNGKFSLLFYSLKTDPWEQKLWNPLYDIKNAGAWIKSKCEQIGNIENSLVFIDGNVYGDILFGSKNSEIYIKGDVHSECICIFGEGSPAVIGNGSNDCKIKICGKVEKSTEFSSLENGLKIMINGHELLPKHLTKDGYLGRKIGPEYYNLFCLKDSD